LPYFTIYPKSKKLVKRYLPHNKPAEICERLMDLEIEVISIKQMSSLPAFAEC
jgi:hypothetical protein